MRNTQEQLQKQIPSGNDRKKGNGSREKVLAWVRLLAWWQVLRLRCASLRMTTENEQRQEQRQRLWRNGREVSHVSQRRTGG
jgi:hypothetical protein